MVSSVWSWEISQGSGGQACTPQVDVLSIGIIDEYLSVTLGQEMKI